MHFNSQPHEEADIERWIEDGRKQYFNSQPHEEADWNQQVCIRIFGISTHSLTRRLTKAYGAEGALKAISTHSLTRRLTPTISSGCFFLNISTHSLTRRLTGVAGILLSISMYFNSQPHEEADLFFVDCLLKFIHFNSQPHEEADNGHLPLIRSSSISTHSLTRRLTPFCEYHQPI